MFCLFSFITVSEWVNLYHLGCSLIVLFLHLKLLLKKNHQLSNVLGTVQFSGHRLFHSAYLFPAYSESLQQLPQQMQILELDQKINTLPALQHRFLQTASSFLLLQELFVADHWLQFLSPFFRTHTVLNLHSEQWPHFINSSSRFVGGVISYLHGLQLTVVLKTIYLRWCSLKK